MKLLTWNVNGIRAVQKKCFEDLLEKENADIVCLQETKAQPDQIQLNTKLYPYYYVNSAEKKGYSGTALFSKVKPQDVSYGMEVEEHDKEGRIICAEFETFYLITVYTPNSGRQLQRLEYRKKWDEDFKAYLKRLQKKKPVLLCGDLNVAHKEIDLKNPKNNMTTKSKPGNAGFTDAEREGMSTLLESGFIDVFRHFYPDAEGEYTWWSYMFNARAKNAGWRIDYFISSPALLEDITSVSIRQDIHGSDHCPVQLEITR